MDDHEFVNFQNFDEFQNVLVISQRSQQQQMNSMEVELQYQNKLIDVVQQNFPKQIIIQMTKFLNNLAYYVLTNNQANILKSQQKSIIHLLKEIYKRDSRIKFIQIDQFWVIKEANDNFQNYKFNQMQIFNQDNNEEEILESNLIDQIINKIPWVLTFEKRLKKMRKLIKDDMEQQDRSPFDPHIDDDDLMDDEQFFNQQNNSKTVTIRRGFEFEDAFKKLSKRNLRNLIKIKFINEQGLVEEGIDGGGLQKEFITSVANKIFDPSYGYFIQTEENTLIPTSYNNLQSDFTQEKMYKFMGKIIGKAIYEDILIEPVFSRAFLNLVLDEKNDFEELKYVDLTLYKNLLKLKHSKENIENYGLSFAIDENVMGVQRQILLKYNGDKIEVTNENKEEYIKLYADQKLNIQFKQAAFEFSIGLQSIINPQWFKMFNHDEIQLIISGKKGFIVEDLFNYCKFNGYNPKSQTILDLKEILEELSDDERCKFLHFVTGCSRPPTLGFKNLQPQFCIQKIDLDLQDPNRLPTAATCMNLLKLPNYNSKQKLKEKILYAINSQAGFDLT